MRRALVLFVMVSAAAIARGNMVATNVANPAEQQDLQAAEAAVAVVTNEKAQGMDIGNARDRLDRMFEGLEAKYPRSAEVRDNYGHFLALTLRNPQALAKYREAEKLDGNNPEVCADLGIWLTSTDGNTRLGTDYMERAVALAPGNAYFHYYLGTSLYLFRHDLTTPQRPETAVVDQALSELRSASDIEPLDPQYARDYADTFYSIPVPRWPEALKAWQHYYEITPDKDFAAINLARVSLQMKDYAGARTYLTLVNGSAFLPLKQKLLDRASAETR